MCPERVGASQLALVVKNPPANVGDARDAGSIPGAGRSPGIGNGNPLQYSWLENSMDREAWWAIVHKVTKKELDTTEQLSTHTLTEDASCPVSCSWVLMNMRFLLKSPLQHSPTALQAQVGPLHGNSLAESWNDASNDSYKLKMNTHHSTRIHSHEFIHYKTLLSTNNVPVIKGYFGKEEGFYFPLPIRKTFDKPNLLTEQQQQPPNLKDNQFKELVPRHQKSNQKTACFDPLSF